MIHLIRQRITDGNHNETHARITLPDIPGVVVTNDRSETDPRSKTIRGKTKRQPCKSTPYALVRAALIDIAEGRA